MLPVTPARRALLYPSSSFFSRPSVTIRRSLWGIGEIIGVITAPGATLQQLGDLRTQLQDAKTEMQEAKERDRLPPVRTFIRTPGYFRRPKEEATIKRVLEGPPNLTVIFGATSVGKTAMLRQILTAPRYLVLPLDLRIAGFADTSAIYYALSGQFEQYFARIGEELEGYREECENIALSFKHARLDVERRMEKERGEGVDASDIASLFELVQNALVRYWRFEPELADEEKSENGESNTTEKSEQQDKPAMRRPPEKKVPVWLIDEAHKLPALVDEDEDCLKTIVDAMVVLTKQERLCHIVHATSDSFYMDILVQLNVAQHAKFIYVDDPDKAATLEYVRSHVLPSVHLHLQKPILDQFDEIYDVIGGKLVHWEDGVREWVDEGIPITQSSHVSQAYVLVNSFLHPSSPSDEIDAFQPVLKPTLRLFSLLSFSPYHVEFYPARREYGPDLIDALIRSRLVEVRWGGLGREEGERGPVVHAGARKPVLVAMTPAVRWAIGRAVEELRTS